MFRPKLVRWALLLIVTSSFFITLYSLTGAPALYDFRFSFNVKAIGNLVNNVSSSFAVTEIISELYERNQTCHQYFTDYLNISDNITLQRSYSSALVLYQPPCPLGNFSDFRFLINKDVCGDGDVYMMILVGSHPSNLQIRNVLRETLGAPDIKNLTFKIAFIFGQVTNASLQRALDEESKKYGDLIQGSFIDAYHNVTLRDLMGLRWAWQYCPQAKYVMRMDDDVSVDIFSLIDVIEQRYDQMSNTVACFQLLIDTPVFRSGRYAVSFDEHPGDKYDTYCQGWMYLIVPRMAYNLDLASLRNKPYWMNDAYITGTLIKALGKEPFDLKINYTINISYMKDAKDKQPPAFTIGPTGNDSELLLSLHRNYQKYARAHNIPKIIWTSKSYLSFNNKKVITTGPSEPSQTTNEPLDKGNRTTSTSNSK